MSHNFGSQRSARRTFARLPAHIAVEVTPDGGETLSGVVHDLSFNGVSVEFHDPALPQGTQADITLLLEDGSNQIRLPGKGRVVRADGKVTAFQFSPMDGEVYEDFERLVLLSAPDPLELDS